MYSYKSKIRQVILIGGPLSGKEVVVNTYSQKKNFYVLDKSGNIDKPYAYYPTGEYLKIDNKEHEIWSTDLVLKEEIVPQESSLFYENHNK